MGDAAAQAEPYILQNCAFERLPPRMKQVLGNSKREYEKIVVQYSLSHQLRWRKNMVRRVNADERAYYTEVLKFSRENLMMYPYHLADLFVVGLRTTPFAYYTLILCDMMRAEKSYDSLPNFSACDCLSTLGIGRNQYIDLMNVSKAKGGFFMRSKKVDPRVLLPEHPILPENLSYWWDVAVGYVTEEDIKNCTADEHSVIDRLIDRGVTVVGVLDREIIESLYRRNLIYLGVPIADTDRIVVPPLEGFVMNRVLGDYFEKLLYKVFVSIDAHTTVGELAGLLRLDIQLVKDAVSAYCRLGHAFKRGTETVPDGGDWHPSWRFAAAEAAGSRKRAQDPSNGAGAVGSGADSGGGDGSGGGGGSSGSGAGSPSGSAGGMSDGDGDEVEVRSMASSAVRSSPLSSSPSGMLAPPLFDESGARPGRRIALCFDSTLTAFLMMGNLSPGLKKHAVTMFEAGKLPDEVIDSFLEELDSLNTLNEGETETYFQHAVILRQTIRFLRRNPELPLDSADGKEEDVAGGVGLDLLRCESVNSLDAATAGRVLKKNYSLLLSMSPLARETRTVMSCMPPHVGPAIPELTSIWFKLWLYEKISSGPPSILYKAGSRVRAVPPMFHTYYDLLVTSAAGEPVVVSTSNLLLMLNDALAYGPVLVQGNGIEGPSEVFHLPFPAPAAITLRIANLAAGTVAGEGVAGGSGGGGGESEAARRTSAEGAATPPGAAPQATTSASSATTAAAAAKKGWEGMCDKLFELDVVQEVGRQLDLQHNVGYLTLVRPCTLPRDAAATATAAEEVAENEWVVFNVSFGIPLFDAKVNARVCAEIQAQKLFQADSLQRLIQSQRREALELIKFIATNQEMVVTLDPSLPGKQQSTATPTVSLMSVDGSLSLL